MEILNTNAALAERFSADFVQKAVIAARELGISPSSDPAAYAGQTMQLGAFPAAPEAAGPSHAPSPVNAPKFDR